MINKLNAGKSYSADYQLLRRDMSLMIYRAVPYGKDIICSGPAVKGAYYNLSHHIHEAVCEISSDVLTKGKASWHLSINPDKSLEMPFAFRQDPIKGFKAVRVVVHSRDIGVPCRNVRRLARRLMRSEVPFSDLSLIRFCDDRMQIADHWGHVLSWRMSDPSTFTDACILLNQCNSKILAIKLCKTIQDAMNEALTKSELADYRIEIPTFSKRELETSKQLFIEGEMNQKDFSDLVFSKV